MCYHCKGLIVFGMINSVILFVIVSVTESRALEIEPLLKVLTWFYGICEDKNHTLAWNKTTESQVHSVSWLFKPATGTHILCV